MPHHDLKTPVEPYQAVKARLKSNEIRMNDRKFQIGDTVTLYEMDGLDFTGNQISAQISYIDTYGVLPGYVNLSYKRIGVLLIRI